MSTFLRIVAILILVTTAVIAAFLLSTSSWPKAEGKVLSGRWAMEDGMPKSERGKYMVEYQFTVAGQEYFGRRLGFAQRTSVVHILNAKEDRQPREGDTVMVSYLPVWPEMCALVPGFDATTLGIWSLVATLVSIMLWIYARISLHPVM
jgi:Protein of unknown function (DUF3592)